MTTTRRVMVYLAFALIAIVLLFSAVLAVFWFWPSDLTIFRFGNVSSHNTYTKFFGPDIENALAHRNLIIETAHTDVEISVRNPGQLDERTITLFEDARGISFNQMHRSHIDWTQVILEDGEVFYKIRVHEPTGAISRRARLIVNLHSDNIGNVVPYNLVFNTGLGNVSITADPAAQHMRIDSIVIGRGSIGRFNFSPPATIGGNLDISRIYVKSSPQTLSASAQAHIVIDSTIGTFNLGNVGSVSVLNGTAVNLNIVNALGDITFSSFGGRLNVTQRAVGKVKVETTDASVNIARLEGRCEILNKGSSNTTITTMIGNVDYIANDRGSLRITTLQGNLHATSIRSIIVLGGNGNGTQGVFGDVDINNTHGNTTVVFGANATGTPATKIEGHHGSVTVNNIVGPIHVLIPPGGTSVITATFKHISAGDNVIDFQGSSLSTSNYGNINVTLIRTGGGFMPFNLEVYSARVARDRTGWQIAGNPGSTNPGIHIPNMIRTNEVRPWDNQPPWPIGSPWPVQGGSARTLRLHTSNAISLGMR